MTQRRAILDFQFVDYIPDELQERIVYIAAEFGAVMHLCCDGCGEKVSTPLSPAQWTLTFDGETISLSPSIGNFDLTCGSHYWIRQNRVHWARSMSRKAIEANAAHDLLAAEQHFAPFARANASHANFEGCAVDFWGVNRPAGNVRVFQLIKFPSEASSARRSGGATPCSRPRSCHHRHGR